MESGCKLRALVIVPCGVVRVGDRDGEEERGYLPHVWVLEDSHYSLDPVHSNALLETAKTWKTDGQTDRQGKVIMSKATRERI